jgi:hypothetical protein
MVRDFRMTLQEFASQNLDWSLNFYPKASWPPSLPVIAVKYKDQILVLAGFDRARDQKLDVLIISESETSEKLELLIDEIWPLDRLAPFERLRLNKALSRNSQGLELLEWPFEIQNFFDERKLQLKSLKPLEFLNDLRLEVTDSFLKLKPSSSETRELIDLLCDLKLSGLSWSSLAPSPEKETTLSWLKKLQRLRAPKTVGGDEEKAQLVGKLSWPRGVRAKWERSGDQAGILLQSKITNQTEWLKLKSSLEKIEIGDSVWNPSM